MPGLQSLSHLNFALKSVGYNLDAASRSKRAQETDTLSTFVIKAELVNPEPYIRTSLRDFT